jgi:hypothetical protein
MAGDVSYCRVTGTSHARTFSMEVVPWSVWAWGTGVNHKASTRIEEPSKCRIEMTKERMRGSPNERELKPISASWFIHPTFLSSRPVLKSGPQLVVLRYALSVLGLMAFIILTHPHPASLCDFSFPFVSPSHRCHKILSFPYAIPRQSRVLMVLQRAFVRFFYPTPVACAIRIQRLRSMRGHGTRKPPQEKR